MLGASSSALTTQSTPATTSPELLEPAFVQCLGSAIVPHTPSASQTFLRQKVTLASALTCTELKQGKLSSDSKVKEMTTLALQRSDHVKCSKEFSNSDGVDVIHAMHFIDQKSEVKGSEGLDLVDSLDKGNLSSQSCSVRRIPSFMLENRCNNGVSQKNDQKDFICMDRCHGTNKKSNHGCPKVNENNSGAGALRYALHLRFFCPSAKKSSSSVRRCKSDPSSAPQKTCLDREGERRFYLYNDLRVVFPQRHSDADEGKLNVEYHFPEDPRYFNISN